MFKLSTNHRSKSWNKVAERYNKKPFLYRAKIHLTTWWWFKFRDVVWYLSLKKLLTIPILIFGIFVNWWLAIIIEYVLTGLLIWIEGWNEKDTIDIGKKKYHKNYIIIYWGYFLLYRLYEVWKDNKLSKTDEEIINEKRYKTLKKIL